VIFPFAATSFPKSLYGQTTTLADYLPEKNRRQPANLSALFDF
jgi:hypothetical protein